MGAGVATLDFHRRLNIVVMVVRGRDVHVSSQPVLVLGVVVVAVGMHVLQRRRHRDRQERGHDKRGNQATHCRESRGTFAFGQLWSRDVSGGAPLRRETSSGASPQSVPYPK